MMYSRRSSGYGSPPPNYNGVAFTRNYAPSTQGMQVQSLQDIKSAHASANREDTAGVRGNLPKAAGDAYEEQSRNKVHKPVDTVDEDNNDACRDCPAPSECEAPYPEQTAGDDDELEVEDKGEDEKDMTERQKDYSMEDLLVMGAMTLFLSGDFDGDAILLLALLLISGS